jgi:hypothetical protein
MLMIFFLFMIYWYTVYTSISCIISLYRIFYRIFKFTYSIWTFLFYIRSVSVSVLTFILRYYMPAFGNILQYDSFSIIYFSS